MTISNYATASGTIGEPQFAAAGSIVTVNPAPGATAVLEYTLSDLASIRNGVAVFSPWYRGVSTVSSSDILNEPAYLRLTSTGGASALVVDNNPAQALMQSYLSPWGSAARYSVNAQSGVFGTIGPTGYAAYLAPANGVIIAGLGDSITYQNTYGSPLLMRAIGYMTWAMALSNGRIEFNNSLNFGVSGETTAQILVRTPAAIASMKAQGAQFCVVHGGTNDISSIPTISPPTTVANLRSIYTQLLAAGITPIAIPILPRSFSMTASQILRLQSTNNQIRALARVMPGVIVADPTLHIADQANASGFPLGGNTAATTAMTIDGLHPATRAAYWMGFEIAQAVASQLPAQSTQTWSQADLYDATDNPTGSLMLNPMMTGTTGTPGTGATGEIATSWGLNRQSGTTGAVVASKVTVATDVNNSYPAQQLVFSAPAGSASETFRFNQLRSSGVAIGDVLYGECEIAITGVGPGSFKYLKLTVSDGVVSGAVMQNDSGFYMPDQSWKGVLRTPKITATVANTALLTLEIQLDGTVASNGVTITVTRMPVRKVL